MSFEYIRSTYQVPAEIGIAVIVDGKPGVIVEDRGHYLGVNFDADKPSIVRSCHPTWRVEYGEPRQIRPMTRSQARYQAFIDADSGLRFGEWLQTLREASR